jgi:hypothetical protein
MRQPPNSQLFLSYAERPNRSSPGSISRANSSPTGHEVARPFPGFLSSRAVDSASNVLRTDRPPFTASYLYGRRSPVGSRVEPRRSLSWDLSYWGSCCSGIGRFCPSWQYRLRVRSPPREVVATMAWERNSQHQHRTGCPVSSHASAQSRHRFTAASNRRASSSRPVRSPPCPCSIRVR